MARQRFPTLQTGPVARETTGLTKGSRRPSAVMIFFALGVSAAAPSLEAAGLVSGAAGLAATTTVLVGGPAGLLVGVAGFAAVTGDFVAGATLIKGLAALGAAFAPAGDGLAPGLAEVWLCDWGVPSASFSFATFCCSAALSLSCVLWMRLGFCPK